MSDADPARVARNESLTAIALMCLAQVAFCFIGPGTLRALLWLRVAHAAVCAAAVIWLWRRRPSVRLSMVTFFWLSVPLFVVFWLDEVERSAARSLWVPFVGPKIAVLGAALLAPSARVGAGLIVALALETGVLAAAYRLAGLKDDAGMFHGEPWVTFVYAGVAIGLLVHRTRRMAAERAATRSRVHAEAMDKQARVFMALRDLANTPLQTLDVNVSLLREQVPEAAELTDRMARAVAKLREMSRLLAAQHIGTWQPGDESIDALHVLGKNGDAGREIK